MILNVIRYRVRSEEEWRTWKFSHAGGRLRSCLCITAPQTELADISTALLYAITGESGSNVQEVALQLSDDGGHTWMVQRRGASLRVLKNGVQIPSADAERELASGVLDQVDVAKLKINRYEFQTSGDEINILKLGGGAAQAANIATTMKEVAQAQMTALGLECAQRLGSPRLAEPRLLTQLCRKIEPLHASYQELARQYQELKEENQGFVSRELPQVAVLASEIELLDTMAETAAPLLAPGVSLKGYKDELARTDGAVAELCAGIGIETPDGRPIVRDFRAAIEALSRLEAQTKLVRSTQQARKFFATKLEPLHNRYLQLAESGLAGDRQVAAELESCLASLGLRLRGAVSAAPSEDEETKPRTWFERFKSGKNEPEATPRARETQSAEQQGLADIETAHMAIAYALKRVRELSGSLEHARGHHDGSLAAIDQSHEELVRAFGKTKALWTEVARAQQLPEDMDLNQLLQVALKHGELAALSDTRAELLHKIQGFGSRLTKVERLVLDWRKLTGSQNVTDLSNPTILLSEAQGILRYHDNKRKRLEQLRTAAAEVKATASIRDMLKGRRNSLLTAWREAFAEAQVPPCEIHDERCPELFRIAAMIKALAIVHAAHQPEAAKVDFAGGAEDVVMSFYSWDDEHTTQKQRLALLHAIDEMPDGELRLFLIADRDLAAMLIPAGMGRATMLDKAAQAQARPAAAATATSSTAPRPARGPVTVTACKPPQPVPVAAAQPLLNERARRALETLTVKK